MSYSAMAVANAFIKRAKEGKLCHLTPMKLQKLMFYAQSWHLKHHPGEPLLDDAFCRWQYGPVIPSIYHEFKDYGSNPITEFGSNATVRGSDVCLVTPSVPETDSATWRHIDAVINAYGDLSGPQLSTLTHRQGGAWAKEPMDGGPISNADLAACLSADGT